MWEVDVKFVGWNVGALCEVTQVAHVALIDDLIVIVERNPIDLERFRLVDKVKKGRERVTQADTTSATVADIVDTCKLIIERVTVPKRFRFPFYRVTSGCIDATFAHVLLPLFKVV